jgi:hypothetical protein
LLKEFVSFNFKLKKLAEAAELIEDKIPNYKYKPTNVLETDNSKLYWNRRIITGKRNTFSPT